MRPNHRAHPVGQLLSAVASRGVTPAAGDIDAALDELRAGTRIADEPRLRTQLEEASTAIVTRYQAGSFRDARSVAEEHTATLIDELGGHRLPAVPAGQSVRDVIDTIPRGAGL